MISKLAFISPEARLAKGVVVEPFAYIEGDVEIGPDSWIGTGAVIRDGSRLGARCEVHTGAVVGGIPQDLKFVGEHSTVVIGDDTQIREAVTVNRGTKSREVTKIGNHCLLMAYSHVAHDCVVGDHVILGNATQLAGEVEIDDWAILSGACLVHQFSRIGCHVMIQGGSKVTKDIPPYSLVGRDPLVFNGLNIVGLRRRNFASETINAIQAAYRVIYDGAYNTTQALEVLESNGVSTKEVREIINFIKGSERGILRSAGKETTP